ncbi:MAG: PilZ domain-containing protein [Lachnospiraceae bacterium]|nr:PilZ domain-containing protein [Lachnospiraceae bacterium]
MKEQQKEATMQEKRQSKRLILGMKLSISDLYKENTNTITDISSSIEVTDISANGIGFISECILPTGYYFIANLELAPDLPQIITDVRIIRSSAIDMERYQYGCEFVSIAPNVRKMLEEFEERLKKEEA